MTLEEVKKELKVFNKFTFFEEDHHYECNGKRNTCGNLHWRYYEE